MLTTFFVSAMLFSSGQPLDTSKDEVQKFCKLAVVYKQEQTVPLIQVYLQTMLNFMGQSSDPLVLTSDALDDESPARGEGNIGTVVGLKYTMTLILAYYFNDYNLAMKMATECENLLLKKKARPTISGCNRIFYHGLSCLALAQQQQSISTANADTAPPTTTKKQYLKAAKGALEQMRKFAVHCPSTFDNKVLLMEGEWLLVHNKLDDAMRKFTASIAKAEIEGLQHEQALAYERAGRALLLHEQQQKQLLFLQYNNQPIKKKKKEELNDAHTYLSKACLLYEGWGAHAKVEQMKKTILLTY